MTPIRYLLLPWWAAQLATGAKSFLDNPVIGSPWLNDRGLHVARRRIARRAAAWRRRRIEHLISPADQSAFARDGFVVRENFLRPAAFEHLRDQALNTARPAREMMQGDTITRRIALDPGALATMPAAAALLRHQDWRGLTRYVSSFDSEPVTYIQTILARVRDAEPDPQIALHADTFHPTMKAWLFLTDVAADEGPFVYVPGSHRLTPERIAWEKARSIAVRDGADRLSARGSFRVRADELAGLCLPPPKLFAVPANTLVVADTSGFHARGPSARPSIRAEIWAYGRRNPFLPWTGLDPFTVPGLAHRRAPLMWAARDRFERLIGQPWADVGEKTAIAPAGRAA